MAKQPQPQPTDEPRGELTEVPADHGILQTGGSIGNLFARQGAAFAHNFAGSPQETFKFVSLAKNGEHKSLQDSIGEKLAVTHFFAHTIELESDDGEIHDAKRVVLFTKDGNSYECVSQGIFDCLGDAVAAFSQADWKRGVTFQVGQRKTRRGYRILTLLPV